MTERKDDGAKWRLLATEYQDMRYLFAALHVMQRMAVHRARFRLAAGSWQKYRAAVAMMDQAAQALLSTVPDADRARLRADLNNSDIYMHTTRVSGIKVDDSDMIFVTRNQMKDVIGYAMEGCALCDKRGEDVVRCKKRKAIHGLFTHALPVFNGTACLWCDYNIGGGDGRELMMAMTRQDVEREKEYEQ